VIVIHKFAIKQTRRASITGQHNPPISQAKFWPTFPRTWSRCALGFHKYFEWGRWKCEKWKCKKGKRGTKKVEMKIEKARH